jgi:hypothetical protein
MLKPVRNILAEVDRNQIIRALKKQAVASLAKRRRQPPRP